MSVYPSQGTGNLCLWQRGEVQASGSDGKRLSNLAQNDEGVPRRKERRGRFRFSFFPPQQEKEKKKKSGETPTPAEKKAEDYREKQKRLRKIEKQNLKRQPPPINVSLFFNSFFFSHSDVFGSAPSDLPTLPLLPSRRPQSEHLRGHSRRAVSHHHPHQSLYHQQSLRQLHQSRFSFHSSSRKTAGSTSTESLRAPIAREWRFGV